jgi:hypothetical protein
MTQPAEKFQARDALNPLVAKLSSTLDRDWTVTILRTLLWSAGPVLSYLFLPIEGEFWNGLMPNGNRFRAYAGCFVLDVTGSVLIYFFGRIQQTARKGGKNSKPSKQWSASWGILLACWRPGSCRSNRCTASSRTRTGGSTR